MARKSKRKLSAKTAKHKGLRSRLLDIDPWVPIEAPALVRCLARTNGEPVTLIAWIVPGHLTEGKVDVEAMLHATISVEEAVSVELAGLRIDQSICNPDLFKKLYEQLRGQTPPDGKVHL